MEEKTMVFDGIPVLIRENERPPRTIRIKIKKPGRKPLKDIPYSKLSPQHQQALDNLAVMGFDKKKEAAIYAGLPEHHALRTMDSLLVGRKTIVKEIEEVCQAKHKKGTDKKVAEVMVECLDATHPMSKENKKDYKAIVKAVSEINKVVDNYPAKKIDVREVGFHLVFGAADIKAAKEYRKLTEEYRELTDEDS